MPELFLALLRSVISTMAANTKAFVGINRRQTDLDRDFASVLAARKGPAPP